MNKLYDKVTELTKNVGSMIVGLDFEDHFILPKGDPVKHEVGGRHSSFTSGIMTVVDLTAPYCAGWKPNLAFYKGSNKTKCLEDLCWYIKKNYPDKLLITDEKPGDIGNTAKMYLEFYQKLVVDAFTFNPLMGFQDSAEIILSNPEIACFTLCLTSNGGADEILRGAKVGDILLWQYIAKLAQEKGTWNKHDNYNLVVGGTNTKEEIGLARFYAGDETVFLMPGFGAQDGDYKNALRAGRNSKRYGVLPMVGRAIIQPKLEVGETIEEGIVRMAKYWQEELEDARAAG